MPVLEFKLIILLESITPGVSTITRNVCAHVFTVHAIGAVAVDAFCIVAVDTIGDVGGPIIIISLSLLLKG